MSELRHTLEVAGSASGIWAAAQPCNYTLSYTGTQPTTATLYVSSVMALATTAGMIEITPEIPANLRPSSSLHCPVHVVDAVSFVRGICILTRQGSISVVPINSNYNGCGNGGFSDFSVTYAVDPTG